MSNHGEIGGWWSGWERNWFPTAAAVRWQRPAYAPLPAAGHAEPPSPTPGISPCEGEHKMPCIELTVRCC